MALRKNFAFVIYKFSWGLGMFFHSVSFVVSRKDTGFDTEYEESVHFACMKCLVLLYYFFLSLFRFIIIIVGGGYTVSCLVRTQSYRTQVNVGGANRAIAVSNEFIPLRTPRISAHHRRRRHQKQLSPTACMCVLSECEWVWGRENERKGNKGWELSEWESILTENIPS